MNVPLFVRGKQFPFGGGSPSDGKSNLMAVFGLENAQDKKTTSSCS